MAGAEITGKNGHKWNANAPQATSGSPHSALLGGPLGSHTISLRPSQGPAGMSAASSQPEAWTRPSYWLVFVCSMHGIHPLIWIYANVAMVPPRQRKLPPRPPHCPPPPVSLHFPRSVPFCLSPCCCLLCSVGWGLWEPDLLCHSDLFKRGVRLLITRHGLTVYEVEGRENGGVFHMSAPHRVSE